MSILDGNVAVDAATGQALIYRLSGEPLTVSVWQPDGSDTALFQTTKPDGTVVIDRGRLQVREV
ncbi:MAG TPA: hypothetical protein VGJ19_08100 [Streptosporangiaceae bacterium]